AARLEQDADQVDDYIAAAHCSRDRRSMAYIRLNCMNLADAAKRLQMAREVRAPHRDADAILPLRQRPHHVPTEKPGAAEDSDQRIGIRFYCHRCLPHGTCPAPAPHPPSPLRGVGSGARRIADRSATV